MSTILTSSFYTDVSDIDNQGNARTLKIFDKKVKPDISNIFTQIDPEKAPFIRFLSVIGNKEKTINYKYEWLEEDSKDLLATLDAGAGIVGSAVSTDLQTNESDLFQADDIIKLTALTVGVNYGTTEIIRIVSKTNATTYVVARAQAGTTGSAVFAANDEVMKIGSSHQENSLQADPENYEPVWYYNLVQNFKSSVAISGRMDSMDVRDNSSEVMSQLKKRMRDHAESIEGAFLFGNRYQDGTRTYTGGLEFMVDTYAPSINYHDASAETFSEGWLDLYANMFFRYGGKRKVALVGGQIISKLGVFGKDYLRINDKASAKLGLEVMDYFSSHGTISFIHSRLLDESDYYKSYMFLFDPKYVKKRFLPGRDTHINMNVQENGRDGKIHEIMSDIGLEVRLPQAHFVVTGLDDTITP